MEKQIEEELMPKEGEDPVDDDTKQLMARKLRFQITTKGFYGPHLPKKPKFKVGAHQPHH
jgi:hypothetical protein